MKNTFYLFGLLFMVLFLAACSSQKQARLEDSGAGVVAEQRALIQQNIPDPERQTALLRIVTEVERQSAEFFSFYKSYQQEIVRLNKNFSTTRQDFERLNTEFNRRYEGYLRTLLEKRDEMKPYASHEEWKKIMARESSFIPE